MSAFVLCRLKSRSVSKRADAFGGGVKKRTTETRTDGDHDGRQESLGIELLEWSGWIVLDVGSQTK